MMRSYDNTLESLFCDYAIVFDLLKFFYHCLFDYAPNTDLDTFLMY